MAVDPDIPGFSSFAFPDGDITHTVYQRGVGRAVVLIHELPGMTPACIEYATELAQSFSVYMPLLFGKPYDNNDVEFVPHICVSREFAALSNRGGRNAGGLVASARSEGATRLRRSWYWCHWDVPYR
jgi:dienelactone hydrolase